MQGKCSTPYFIILLVQTQCCMRERFNSLLLVILCALLFWACEEEQPAAPPPPPEIQVIEVLQKDVPIYAEYPGQTYGELDIAVRARVEGFLNSRHFDEGTQVQKGQLLYIIDPQPYEAKVAEAKSRVAEANTGLVKAESDLNRIRPLAAQNAVSQADLDAAEAQYGAAQASVEAAKASQELAEIQLSYSRIEAPVSGIIGKTEAKVGDFVGREPNPVLLTTISNVDRILFRFSIPEAEYLRLVRLIGSEEERQERFNDDEDPAKNMELILADGSTHPYKGSIDFAEREIDASTGTLLLQASFDNPQRIIRPGQYAKVRFVEQIIQNGLLVPQRCISELQGQFYVFRVNQNNEVGKQTITVGDRIGDMWLVTDGLNAGDRIVIDGIQKVRADMQVNPKVVTFDSKHPDL